MGRGEGREDKVEDAEEFVYLGAIVATSGGGFKTSRAGQEQHRRKYGIQ